VSKANGEIAVDTNAVIAFLEGEPRVAGILRGSTALFLPAICLGELEYGALHSARSNENLARLHAFADTCGVVPVTRNTASHYGRIRQGLATKGRPIPEADLWIAAICIEHDLPLLSNDAHFDFVSGILRQDWSASAS